MDKPGFVYILTNDQQEVLYTGVTSNLTNRMDAHSLTRRGFAKKYNCTRMVYFEDCGGILEAIFREKQIKAGSRKKKIQLIEKMNPRWEDLKKQF